MPEQTDIPEPTAGAETPSAAQPATPDDFPAVKFDARGLVPCVVQEWTTGEVLMLAYMNPESLRRTLETGTTWFFSRSRNEYWNKGATSGHFQKVHELRYDCDGDTLLAIVEQTGAACHTGDFTCFDGRWLSSAHRRAAALSRSSRRVGGHDIRHHRHRALA